MFLQLRANAMRTKKVIARFHEWNDKYRDEATSRKYRSVLGSLKRMAGLYGADIVISTK